MVAASPLNCGRSPCASGKQEPLRLGEPSGDHATQALSTGVHVAGEVLVQKPHGDHTHLGGSEIAVSIPFHGGLSGVPPAPVNLGDHGCIVDIGIDHALDRAEAGERVLPNEMLDAGSTQELAEQLFEHRLCQVLPAGVFVEKVAEQPAARSAGTAGSKQRLTHLGVGGMAV